MNAKEYLNVWPNIQHVTIGLWILSLYASFIFAVIFSLSLHQFQHDLRQLPYDLGNNEYENALFSHQCDISSVKNSKSIKSTFVWLPCFKQAQASVSVEETALDRLKRYKADRIFLEGRIRQKREYLRNLESAGDPFLKGNAITAKKNLEEDLKALEKLDEFTVRIAQLVQDSKFYDSLFSWFLFSKDGKLEESSEPNLNVTAQAGVRGAHADEAVLRAIQKSVTDVEGFKDLWTIPGALLSIVLILSMGGLGSLIAITVEYLRLTKNDWGKSRFSNYLFRPLLGAVMALAVYVAIKSGHSVFGEVYAELSPYMLSFVGLLSGLMTEHFYRKIVGYGEKLI